MTTNRLKRKVEWAAKGRRAQLSRNSPSILSKNFRSGSGGQIVAMMQAAKPCHRYDPMVSFGILLCFAASRCSLPLRKMSSVLVVITDVLVHEAFQMPFVENDYRVEQITAAIADPTLCNAFLPWASEAGSLGLDAETLRRVDHFFVELCAAIEDQITRRRVVRKCLAQLLDDPGAGKMLREVAVQDATPVMCNDEEAVQNAKVSVGTMKKSIAAIASRWLFRKVIHLFAGSGLRGAFRIQRSTVRSETSRPSIFSSP